ncbi:MAG: phosphomethylpyrimidine synthase ThiC [Planctomycetes bacterium]|jgi:phosphomethylpyrimidine synthase|nr:phosphomethylpyrimidine synthase ThiC [Planctomycetota bacterium]
MEKLILGNTTGKTNIPFGKNLPTLINFIVGTNSKNKKDIDLEIKKIDIAAELGVHTITDLSTIRLDIPLWAYVKEKYPHIGVGFNPPYLVYAENKNKIPPEKLFNEIKNFILNGGDQMTVNFFPYNIDDLHKIYYNRLIPITGRQGGMLATYIRKYNQINPYHEIFEDFVEILKTFGIIIHLGASFRPAGICEANDCAHNDEIEYQFNIFKKLNNLGIKTVIETMSHQPLETIRSGIENLRQRHNEYIPFQQLGPIVTDIAEENDHIAAVIGIAEAARYNVGKITVVPPREHIGFPTIEDSIMGIKSAKIAVHAGDSTRIHELRMKDEEILKLRLKSLSCNPSSNKKGCEKCGPYCPLILTQKKLYEKN